MDLRRVGWLAKKEIMHIRRDRMAFKIIFGLPIVQLLLIGYAATMDVDHIPTALCDEDASGASRQLALRLAGSSYFDLVAAPRDHRHIKELLDWRRVKLAVIVPRGYERGLAEGRPVEIGLVLDGADATTARIASSYLTAMLADEGIRRVELRLEKMGAPVKLPPVVLKPAIWYNPELRSRDFMVPGVLGMVVLTLILSLTTVALVAEREVGTLERLVMAPISPAELMLGKTGPYLALGMLVGGLTLLVAKVWFGIPIRGSLVFLGLGVSLLVTSTLGLGLFMSALARTQQQAILTNVFVILPSMLLSGFVAPIGNMPVVVQYLTQLIPLRYFLEIARGVCLKGLTPMEVWPQVAALAGLTVAALVAGAAMLRRRL
jgi:ABC-2 type transport system permease protein